MGRNNFGGMQTASLNSDKRFYCPFCNKDASTVKIDGDYKIYSHIGKATTQHILNLKTGEWTRKVKRR